MGAAHAQPFGDLLRHHRLSAGLSQEDLAARAGLSPRGISDLERGVRRVPRPSTLTLLADALGLEPQERSALFAAISRYERPPEPAPHVGRITQPRLVGRTRELAALQAHLAGEGPPVLLLAGEPGIGKTRLLEEAATRATEDGWTVLAGGCTRRGGQEPYAPLLEAIAGRLRHQTKGRLRQELEGCAWLARLLPEVAEMAQPSAPPRALPPEQERRLLFAAVGRFLANAAGPAGTLLALDDLQWAGGDALDLLAELVRSAETPLRVVGAYRGTEVDAQHPFAGALVDLAREGLVTRAQVGPLSHEEAADLLRELLPGGAEDRALAVQLVRRCGGVPFYLVSWARGPRAGALTCGEGAEVPWDAAQSIRLRVAALPAAARELLGEAAVVGRELTGALMATLTGSPDLAVAAALEAACQAQLLVDLGEDRYQFAHDLIREVVEADLSSTRRRMLHRAAAEALARDPDTREGPPALLAYHYEQAGDPVKAVECLRRAARRATRMGAFAEAENHLRHAIALAPEEEQVRLYEELGDAVLWISGYFAYQAAFSLWRRRAARDPAVGARLLHKMLFTCIRAAGIDPRPGDEELADLRAEARRLAATIGDEDERWRLRVAAAFPPCWQRAVTPAEVSEGRAVALAAAAYFEARGEWVSFSAVLDAYGNLLYNSGAYADLVEVAHRRLRAPDLPAMERGDALGVLVAGYLGLGDFGRSIATMREALGHLRPGESLEAVEQCLRHAAVAAWWSGRWGDLDDILAAVAGLPRQWVWFEVRVATLLVAMAREDAPAADGAAALLERLGERLLGPGMCAVFKAFRRDDPALIPVEPMHGPESGQWQEFGQWFVPAWSLAFFSEHGVTAPDTLLDAARAAPFAYDKVNGLCRAFAEALAAGDNARLAAAIEHAEERGLIPHAARMRIVLAQRTRDRAHLGHARPVLERLGDRQFLRRLERVAAELPSSDA